MSPSTQSSSLLDVLSAQQGRWHHHFPAPYQRVSVCGEEDEKCVSTNRHLEMHDPASRPLHCSQVGRCEKVHSQLSRSDSGKTNRACVEQTCSKHQDASKIKTSISRTVSSTHKAVQHRGKAESEKGREDEQAQIIQSTTLSKHAASPYEKTRMGNAPVLQKISGKRAITKGSDVQTRSKASAYFCELSIKKTAAPSKSKEFSAPWQVWANKAKPQALGGHINSQASAGSLKQSTKEVCMTGKSKESTLPQVLGKKAKTEAFDGQMKPFTRASSSKQSTKISPIVSKSKESSYSQKIPRKNRSQANGQLVWRRKDELHAPAGSSQKLINTTPSARKPQKWSESEMSSAMHLTRRDGFIDLDYTVGEVCCICRVDLAVAPEEEESEFRNLPVVCILPCGHAFHHDCLKGVLDEQHGEPPCILCFKTDLGALYHL